MTLENFNYRTDPLFLRNQFDSANSFGIPDIPKPEFTEDELKKDRKSTRLNSSHDRQSRMPSSA